MGNRFNRGLPGKKVQITHEVYRRLRWLDLVIQRFVQPIFNYLPVELR